jgi:hypothetical protein
MFAEGSGEFQPIPIIREVGGRIFSKFIPALHVQYTDKKENKIVLIYKEIQMGSGAKSYMRKGFLIYEEMRKYFTIYEEAFSLI